MSPFYKNTNSRFSFAAGIKICIVQLLLVGFISVPGTGQNYTVNSNADTHAANASSSAVDGSGNITLRSAMEASTQIAGTHIITIPASITSITLSLGQITAGNAATGNNISVVGGGKSVLTINQTTAKRIFNTGSGAIIFSLSDMTLKYTGSADTVGGSGGAIHAGGAGASTTLTNVAINNFTIQVGNGGALSASAAASHNLTLTNCDFNNNKCGGSGGAVCYIGNGICSVTNCKFTNNKTIVLGINSGGDGGALSTSGSGSGGTYSVSGCTFINNSALNATAHGGAIMNTNGALTVVYCRFVGNSAPLATNGNSIAQTGGTSVNSIISNNNWWGANAPGSNDNNVLAAGGNISISKWLQLKLTASSASICPNDSSIITAGFLSNSASEVIAAANLNALNGVPVSFVNPVSGSFSNVQTTIQPSGTATATYLSGSSSPGSVFINGVVDNVSSADLVSRTTVTIGAYTNGGDTTASACNSFTWHHGIVYYHSGDKYDTIPNPNGCGTIITLHLTINSVPNTYSKTDAGCFGSATGSASITPTGGVGPYTYRLGTTGPINSATGAFSNLKAGSYRLYVQDATGCIGVAGPVVVSQSPKVNATITPTPVSGCFGNSNGVLTISNPVGTSPFMYKLGGGGVFTSFTPPVDITGLKAGNYIVYIQDADGCSGSTGSTTVSQPLKVTASKTITNASCYNASDGKITISNPVGVSPFLYKFGSNGVFTAMTAPVDYTGLKAGNYSVYIQDANGCEGVVSCTVGHPLKVAATLAGTNLSCYGSADGKINISNVVGVSPYQYKFGTGGTYASFTPPFDVTGLTAGNYGVYIQDANGCVGAAGVVALTQPAAVPVSFTKTDITCGSLGSLTLSSSGNPTATFKINPGSSIYTSQSTYTNLVAGTYYGYAKDASGCAGRAGPIVFAPATGCATFANASRGVIETGNTVSTLQVSLSPNPSINQFMLIAHSSSAQSVTIRVMDAVGRSVYKAKGQVGQSFRFGDQLSNGLYLVEVRQGDEVRTVKAVKGR